MVLYETFKLNGMKKISKNEKQSWVKEMMVHSAKSRWWSAAASPIPTAQMWNFKELVSKWLHRSKIVNYAIKLYIYFPISLIFAYALIGLNSILFPLLNFLDIFPNFASWTKHYFYEMCISTLFHVWYLYIETYANWIWKKYVFVPNFTSLVEVTTCKCQTKSSTHLCAYKILPLTLISQT